DSPDRIPIGFGQLPGPRNAEVARSAGQTTTQSPSWTCLRTWFVGQKLLSSAGKDTWPAKVRFAPLVRRYEQISSWSRLLAPRTPWVRMSHAFQDAAAWVSKVV